MYGVSWTRYAGRALADRALTEDALFAELEGYVRVQNPNLTDIRLERATATEAYDSGSGSQRRWYDVTYLADNGEGS
jgi:hypothetical protein